MTVDTSYKFVVVLNKKVEAGRVLNAAAHMALALAAKAPSELREKMGLLDYEDADGGKHPISGLSLVVLKADNANKIRTARADAAAAGILLTDFTESMTQDSYMEQMARTKEMKEEALEYWGLCLFGLKEIIDPITRKFSLWT